MTRPLNSPFQLDLPVYVKFPFSNGSKHMEVGKEWNWKAEGVDYVTVMSLYNSDYLLQKDEPIIRVGDGLDELEIETLHDIVDRINAKVATSGKDAANKRCQKSTVKQKQVGLIRGWRVNYGELE